MQLSAMRFLVYVLIIPIPKPSSSLVEERLMRVIVFLKESLCVGSLSSATIPSNTARAQSS
jgi:hypothetical protein